MATVVQSESEDARVDIPSEEPRAEIVTGTQTFNKNSSVEILPNESIHESIEVTNEDDVFEAVTETETQAIFFEPEVHIVEIIETPEIVEPSSLPLFPKAVYTTPDFDVTEMLNAHNAVRKEVGLDPLMWSYTLVQSAQDWADTLKARGCVMNHDVDSVYGENIYVFWSTGGNGSTYMRTPQFVVDRFASEESLYNYEKNTCKPGEKCGHYTQLVWANTTEVGCAVSMCNDGEKQTDVWVCKYNPAGNNGLRPY